MHIHRLPAVSVALWCLAVTSLHAQPTYVSFDVPNADGTYPQSINNDDAVTGFYIKDGLGTSHGFVRSADGTIETFDAPGAGSGGTLPAQINAKGEIVGAFFDENLILHGFLRQPGGAISTFDDPDSPRGTYAAGVNRKGVIVGYIGDINSGPEGFKRSKNGKFIPIGVPGATQTIAWAINALGQIAGQCRDVNGEHDYLRTVDGTYTKFDPPGAFSTSAYRISNLGSVLGWGYDSSGHYSGYLRSLDGAIATFDPANGEGNGTIPSDINSSDVVVGEYYDPGDSHKVHGFLRTADGTISTWDYPHSRRGATIPYGINDSTHITGAYHTAFYAPYHGFLRFP